MAGYAAKEQEPIRRVVYGTTEPQNAPGQSMTLQQVEVDPGAKLPEHFHEGTQLATIKAGVLTYEVVSGSVTVLRKDGTSETLGAPNTLKLRVGDTLVENEALVHYGANNGDKKVVLDVAALLRDGAPLATTIGSGATGDTVKLETTLSSQSRTLYQVGPGNESTYGWNRLTGTSSLNGQPVSIEMLASSSNAVLPNMTRPPVLVTGLASVDVVEPTGVAEHPSLGERPLDPVNHLPRPLVHLRRVLAKRDELLVLRSGADPEVEPATGQDVGDRRVLGNADRVVERQQRHCRTDPQALGPGRDGGRDQHR
jgi:hypothetical protein